MKTEQIFKKIYNELKEEMMKNKDEIFLKEYNIPSINYSHNEDLTDMYFASGIEMELERMMEYFENKIYFMSYKDKYFFSNNKETVQEKILSEMELESTIGKDLKQKLDEKIDKEFEDFITKLRKCTPEKIIESAYEKVTKEELTFKIKNKDYDRVELNALLKTENILNECYNEWMESDVNFNELLDDIVDDSVVKIAKEYIKEKNIKTKESR